MAGRTIVGVNSISPWAWSLSAGLSALVVVFCLIRMTDAVLAQGAARDAYQFADTQHRSHISIPPCIPFPTPLKLRIGLNKSMLFDLPVDLQNVLVSNPEVV